MRTVKGSLRKTLGKNCLTRIELETCLTEVESCLNSRPLTFVGDEPDSSFPLTPCHFLTGRVAGTRLSVVDDAQRVTASVLRERDLERQELLSKFGLFGRRITYVACRTRCGSSSREADCRSALSYSFERTAYRGYDGLWAW